MRAVVAVVIAGCHFSSPRAGDDAHHGDDGAGNDGTVSQCDAPATWADGLAATATIYVAPTTTGTPDGTMAHPFTSIAVAVAAAAPGTKISLAAGSYPGELVSDAHGTQAAPLWIEGPATGTRASVGGLQLVRPQYVVVRHLDLGSTSLSAFNADDGGDRTDPVAHHLVLDDVAASSAAQRCFQVTGVSDLTIERSSAMGCERGVMLIGVHRARLSRLAIANTTTAGVQAAAGSDDIELRQSRIDNGGTFAVWLGGISDETEFRPPLTQPTGNYEVASFRVFDNVIHGSTAGFVCGLCTSSLVAANYYQGSPAYVLHLVVSHGALSGFAFVESGGLHVADNAFEVDSNPYGLRVDTGTDGASCTFANNLWFESDDPANSTPSLPSPETNGVYGVPSGYDANGHICSGAAVGAGVALPEVPGTQQGACRGSPPSIGPDEPPSGC
jgi:hypothetical protein